MKKRVAMTMIAMTMVLCGCGRGSMVAKWNSLRQGPVNSDVTRKDNLQIDAGDAYAPVVEGLKEGDIITLEEARAWISELYHWELCAIKRGDRFEIVYTNEGKEGGGEKFEYGFNLENGPQNFRFLKDRFSQEMSVSDGDELVIFVNERSGMTTGLLPIKNAYKVFPGFLDAVTIDGVLSSVSIGDWDRFPVKDFLVSGDVWDLELDTVDGKPALDLISNDNMVSLTDHIVNFYQNRYVYLVTGETVRIAGYAGSNYKEVEFLPAYLVLQATQEEFPEMKCFDKDGYAKFNSEYTKEGYIILGRAGELAQRDLNIFAVHGNLIFVK